MPLCTPTLIGPISEWSSSLLVHGTVRGSTVTVRSIGPHARQVATASNVAAGKVRIALPGKLHASDLLVVKQESVAGTSAETPAVLALPVAAAPTSFTGLPGPHFVSHVIECGRALWIGGAVPGSEVTISHGTTVLGKGVAKEDHARLHLSHPVPSAGATIHVTQAAPAGFDAPSGTPAGTSTTSGHAPGGKGALPPVTLAGSAPHGCDSGLRIGDVIDGAQVTVHHVGGGLDDTAMFDRDELAMRLQLPLAASGETLHITQAIADACHRAPSPPLVVHVASAAKPAAPKIGELCPGAMQLFVTGLTRGATIIITIDGVEFFGAAPPGEASATVIVPRLHANSVVTLQQQDGCMTLSGVHTVHVQPHAPATIVGLEGELHAGAREVRVTGAHVGAYLQVWAQTGRAAARPISPRITAAHANVTVDVTPALVAGDSVWVDQLACAGAWESSRHTHVT